MIIYNSLFWVTLLDAYTGARLSELCGLMPADIDDAAKIPCIEIRPNEIHPRLKTKASKRRIAIRPD